MDWKFLTLLERKQFFRCYFSLEGTLDENRELPGHFLHELYKWALECKLVSNRYQVQIN